MATGAKPETGCHCPQSNPAMVTDHIHQAAEHGDQRRIASLVCEPGRCPDQHLFGQLLPLLAPQSRQVARPLRSLAYKQMIKGPAAEA